MKAKPLLLLSLLVAAHGCALTEARRAGHDVTGRLREMDAELAAAERTWAEAIDDPWTRPELKRRYAEMQELCRECASRRGGFDLVEQKDLCDRVAAPFDIYYNKLRVKVNHLEEQLDLGEAAAATASSTVAREYRRRPSNDNLEKLRKIFDQVHRYYVGDRYTWTRYINKYAFQKARGDRFRKDFLDRDAEYLALLRAGKSPPRELLLARRRADFAFSRLKGEYVTNNLPPAGEVNAFYRARSLDDYHRLAVEEAALETARRSAGKRKEVVVFVHGLGETRAAWGGFPELLAGEDAVNPAMADRYFKVYLFQYDTVEDSKSVEGFRNELAGFVSDVIRDEGVPRVHLIGHSLGAVLCLKYIGHEADALLKGVDRTDPAGVAEAIIRARIEGRYPRTVASFIAIAGSLSGSEIANIAADRFIPHERLYRASLPLFRRGVPGYGDIQVRENQIGSEVNLASFRRLDTERPLDPASLARFLPAGGRAAAAPYLPALGAAGIPSLCIVGDPVKAQSLLSRHGLMKMGEVGSIFRVDGLFHALDSLQRDEDDGLVKSYSANLNHGWLTENGDDIGYRGGAVRYTSYGHFSICRADSRLHPAYRYAVSFLCRGLLPQMEPERYRIDLFAVLMRFFPEGAGRPADPGSFFLPEERVVYLEKSKLLLPGARVKPAAGRGARPGPCAENVRLGRPAWNRMTGVYFCEGRVVDPGRPARAAFLVSADGYEDALVALPVRPGEATYAVDVVLKKKGDHR
jgi:pimeloyl-ACP methyl ester carboxylesterase